MRTWEPPRTWRRRTLRLPIGQIAANEAQHLGALEALEGRSVIGKAFAPALQIGSVSDALDEYES